MSKTSELFKILDVRLSDRVSLVLSHIFHNYKKMYQKTIASIGTDRYIDDRHIKIIICIEFLEPRTQVCSTFDRLLETMNPDSRNLYNRYSLKINKEFSKVHNRFYS